MKTVLAAKPQFGGFPGGLGGVFPGESQLQGAAAPLSLQMNPETQARNEVIKIAKENPQKTAKLIKSWIDDK
jgi:flagellar biosynthesis/type III secretory pathway M-ring protein FliF/YscJ